MWVWFSNCHFRFSQFVFFFFLFFPLETQICSSLYWSYRLRLLVSLFRTSTENILLSNEQILKWVNKNVRIYVFNICVLIILYSFRVAEPLIHMCRCAEQILFKSAGDGSANCRNCKLYEFVIWYYSPLNWIWTLTIYTSINSDRSGAPSVFQPN